MDEAQARCNTSRSGVLTGPPWSGFDGPPLVQAIPSRLPFVDLRPAFVAEKAAGLLAKLLRGETPSPRRISVAPVFVCL